MLVLPRVRISGFSAVVVIENWLLVIQRYDRVVLIMVPGRRKRLTRPSPLRIVRESFPSPRPTLWLELQTFKTDAEKQ